MSSLLVLLALVIGHLQELKRKGVDKIISKQVKLGKLYIGDGMMNMLKKLVKFMIN